VRGGAAVTAGTPDPADIVAAIGEGLIVVLIGFIGFQLLSSTRSAKQHLKSALSAPANARAARAARRSDPATVGGTLPAAGPHVAQRSDDSDDSDAQQIVEQLNEYYAANISQGYAIFWASLLAMVIGFTVILAGIDAAGPNSTTAIVAGIAGIFSQFIAATFLVALRSTQQQSTVYAQTLADLRVRDLRATADARAQALGLRLVAEIAADGAQQLANATRATIATGLMARDGAVTPAPAPPPAPNPIPVDQELGSRTAARIRAESIAFDTAKPLAET
jgi:hypothetical protein